MLNEAVCILDKPIGPTSFDLVRDLKKIYPKEKIGHGGSLDPFASGTLIVLLGRATKFSQALLGADKVYEATLRLGTETDSLDCTGKLVKEAPVPDISRAQVEACFRSLVGEWLQTPPMFSAKKVQGVRLYELARQQITIPREKVAVQLFNLELLSLNLPEIVFTVHCSKGTYVRSLGQEIAQKLGTLGHLTSLRRTRCGPFSLDRAWTVQDIREAPELARKEGYLNFNQLVNKDIYPIAKQFH